MGVKRLGFMIIAAICFSAAGCATVESEPAFSENPNPHWLSNRSPPSSTPELVRLPTVEPVAQPTIQLAAHAIKDDTPAPKQLPDLAPYAETSVVLQPRTVDEVLNPTPPPEPEPLVPEPTVLDLDLTETLAMAGGQSPRIAFAAARYREAYGRLQAARTLWLPSIRAGLSFNHHDGRLQNAAGSILNVHRSSLQSGLGLSYGGFQTPGVLANFHTADLVFQPKIAAHAASARSVATRTAGNDVLLSAALAHLEAVRAAQETRIARATRGKAKSLADLTATFARAGSGTQADADRAQTELFRRQNDESRAREATRVASARLSQILSLDPSVEIVPKEPTVTPIELVSHDLPLTDLLATGLENRPELAEARYLICEAVHRYRREKYAPLVPSVLLGMSQSGFGGGSGSTIGNFAGRFDFDAAVYWELRNFGFGERAKRNETRALYDQARMRQVEIMDRVAREIVEASAQVNERKQQITAAETGIQFATDSYERNLARIRGGEGLPIEVLQSLQALDDASREYLQSVVDYNDAQFRLHRALGWPIH